MLYRSVFITVSNRKFWFSCIRSDGCKNCSYSTNTGGLPEVNIQGKTGFLSDLGDIKDMAKNAISILKEDAILDQFKRNAKEHTKKFSLQNILPVYEEIYNSCYKTKV